MDQPVRLGIRPEAVTLATTDQAHVTLPLVAVEALGHERLLHFPVHPDREDTLIVRVPGNVACDPGDRIPLQLNTGALYVFDRDGNTIHPEQTRHSHP